MVMPPNWREWLESHVDRQCHAKSKRAGRRYRRIATPGYAVCATHGSKSRGRFATRWDCRPSAVPKKVVQVRAYWLRHGSDGAQPEARSTPWYAHELTQADLDSLMASRDRS